MHGILHTVRRWFLFSPGVVVVVVLTIRKRHKGGNCIVYIEEKENEFKEKQGKSMYLIHVLVVSISWSLDQLMQRVLVSHFSLCSSQVETVKNSYPF